LRHPSKFKRVSRLAFVTAATSLTVSKLCTMFGCLLRWYIIHTFSRALAPLRNFARCNIHFTSKSCFLLYWQRYCTALQQRVSTKLCGVVQGMELRNCRGGHHLYSAGRPSRWASAHILVCCLLHQISRLLTVMALFDVKRRSLTLFPLLLKPELVLTVKWWQIGPYIALKSNRKSGTASSFMWLPVWG